MPELDTTEPRNGRPSGWVASGFEEVRAEFERNFAERDEIGAAVAAYWRGEKVVDLWGGRRTPSGDEPWNEDTMVEEGKRRGVGGDPTGAGRDKRREDGNLEGVAQLVRPFEAVDPDAEVLALLEIALLEGTDLDAVSRAAPRRAAHHNAKLLDLEAKRRIERERPHVEGVLKEAYAGRVPSRSRRPPSGGGRRGRPAPGDRP